MILFCWEETCWMGPMIAGALPLPTSCKQTYVIFCTFYIVLINYETHLVNTPSRLGGHISSDVGAIVISSKLGGHWSSDVGAIVISSKLGGHWSSDVGAIVISFMYNNEYWINAWLIFSLWSDYWFGEKALLD